MASDFYKYFKENMDSLGLDCPETLFATNGTAVNTAVTILSAIQQHGSKVTVAELVGAGTGLEKLPGVLMHWPGIYKPQMAARKHYRQSWSRP
jgi:hypothetical protein